MRIVFARVSAALCVLGGLASFAAACTLVEPMDEYTSGAGNTGDAGAQTDGTATPDHEAGPITTPDGSDATVTSCTETDTKSCNGVCHSIFDPQFGCGATSCDPCTLANAAVDGCESSGACRLGACLTGYADCNGIAGDGCEAKLSDDKDNCGTCKTKCDDVLPNGGGQCVGGKCQVSTCATGFADCNASSADGCEVDTQTDVAHCGTCATACPTVSNTTFACSSGSCHVSTCQSGYLDCDAVEATGCECGHAHATVHCVAPSDPDAGAGATCALTSCNGTYADCNGNLAQDGCEVDTSNDSNNCGTCGFSCEQGACVGGRCQPKQIIGSQGNPGQLVLDLDYAYWSNYGASGINGSIYRVRKDAVNPTLIAGGNDTSENSAWGIATGDATSSVYWTTYSATSHVGTSLKIGGAKSVIANATGRLRGAALDGTYLYWANYEQSAILRQNIAIAGAPVETVAITGTNGAFVSRPNTITFDASSVYWTNEGTAGTPTTSGVPTSVTGTGSVVSVTKASIGTATPAFTTLASNQDKPRGLVVDDTFAYFTNVGTAANSGQLARVGKDATGLTVIASGLGTPREVALCTGTGCASDPYLYVSTYAGGTILRVAKTAPAASPMTTLASGQKGPLGIATDAKYIFWANYGTTGVADGTIMKLVKQP